MFTVRLSHEVRFRAKCDKLILVGHVSDPRLECNSPNTIYARHVRTKATITAKACKERRLCDGDVRRGYAITIVIHSRREQRKLYMVRRPAL